jgi:hypothetical protein
MAFHVKQLDGMLEQHNAPTVHTIWQAHATTQLYHAHATCLELALLAYAVLRLARSLCPVHELLVRKLGRRWHRHPLP